MEVRSGGYEKGEATFNGGPLLAQTGVVAPYSGGGVGAQHVALHSRNIGPSICHPPVCIGRSPDNERFLVLTDKQHVTVRSQFLQQASPCCKSRLMCNFVNARPWLCCFGAMMIIVIIFFFVRQ